jgi:hypothetical protein
LGRAAHTFVATSYPAKLMYASRRAQILSLILLVLLSGATELP